jgi:hypothetical protein
MRLMMYRQQLSANDLSVNPMTKKSTRFVVHHGAG